MPSPGEQVVKARIGRATVAGGGKCPPCPANSVDSFCRHFTLKGAVHKQSHPVAPCKPPVRSVMARRSKQPSSSPNTILVVFLVLFILSNIGFAVWVVNLFGERDKWDKDAKANADKATAADTKADFWKLYASDLRAAVGDPEFFNK